MNLEHYSNDELNAELKRRQESAEAAAKLARREKLNVVITHRDVLANFMTHGRRSCVNGKTVNAGFHPEHGGAECNLCALLDLSHWDTDVEVNVEVTLKKI